MFSAAALPADGQADHRPARSDLPRPAGSDLAGLSGLSSLTAGDRDIIAAMFGPLALTGSDSDGVSGEATGFVAILVADRTTGRLPAGVEVTSSYLQGVWDAFPNYAGPGSLARPLTKKNLADGLYFLGRRSHGAMVDVRA